MRLIILLFFLTFPNFLQAYIGPGMAGGIIATSFAVIAAIFVCLFGILWFPLKRYLKKRKNKIKNSK